MPYVPNPQPNQDQVSTQNKEVVRQVMKAFNDNDVTIIDQVIHPGIVQHSAHPIPANGDPVGAMKKEITMPHQAFPDGQFAESLIISEGDMVFLGWSWSGTNTGSFLGRPPSGKRVSVHAGEVVRVKDGKVVEHWDQFFKPRLEVAACANQLDQALIDQFAKANLL